MKTHGKFSSLNKVLDIVADTGVSIVQIQQDRSDPDIAPNKTELTMILEVPDKSALNQLLMMLGLSGLDFSLVED